MKALLFAWLVSSATAFAPHSGETVPVSEARQKAEASKAADPHAGHATEGAPDAETPSDPHAGHDMESGTGSPSMPPDAPPPAAALSGPQHAADVVFGSSAMEQAREQLRAEQGGAQTYRVMIDEPEARIRDGQDGYAWVAQGWYGGDINKLWIKTEGEGRYGEKSQDAELQALWSRAITPWVDVQVGTRYDFRPDPERGYLAAGLQALVPYLFDIDTAAFFSDEGDVSVRLKAGYDLLITQRLILQPRAETNLAVQTVRELGIGNGFNDVELGLRLRYEFAREFAPYAGLNWKRKLGKTADFARDDGENVDSLYFVVGVRVWF